MQEQYKTMGVSKKCINAWKMLFGEHFNCTLKPFIGPYFMVFFGVLLSTLPLLITNKMQNPNMILIVSSILLALLGIIYFCFGFWKVLVAMLVVSKCTYKILNGEKPLFEEEKAALAPRLGEYVWLLTIMALIYGAFIILPIIVGLINPFAGILAGIIVFIALIFITLGLQLVTPIFAIRDNIKPIEAIKESFVSGKKMHIFLMYFFIAISLLPLAFFGLIPILGQVLNVFATILQSALCVIALTHLYMQITGE